MTHVIKLQHSSIPMPPGGQATVRKLWADTLGLPEVLPPSSLDQTSLVWFKLGGDQEIHCFEEPSWKRNANPQHLCIQVDDLAAVRAALEEGGYAIEDHQVIHNRPRFFFRDGFDNYIEITQITGPYDEEVD